MLAIMEIKTNIELSPRVDNLTVYKIGPRKKIRDILGCVK
jgi:hypothetical protein